MRRQLICTELGFIYMGRSGLVLDQVRPCGMSLAPFCAKLAKLKLALCEWDDRASSSNNAGWQLTHFQIAFLFANGYGYGYGYVLQL